MALPGSRSPDYEKLKKIIDEDHDNPLFLVAHLSIFASNPKNLPLVSEALAYCKEKMGNDKNFNLLMEQLKAQDFPFPATAPTEEKSAAPEAFMREQVAPRLDEMKAQIPLLNESFQRFNQLLISTKKTDEFVEQMQKLFLQGAKKRYAKKEHNSFFHNEARSLELADYVSQILLRDEQPPVIAVITGAAAAYLDVIQGKSSLAEPLKDEKDSAAQFSIAMKHVLANLKKNLLNGRSPAEAKDISDIINKFTDMVPFLSSQLIVLPAFLESMQCSLLELTGSASAKSVFDYPQRLMAVADRSLSLLPEVVADRYMTFACQIFYPEAQDALASLRKALKLDNDEHWEGFLLRLTDNVRRFLESDENELTDKEISTIASVFNAARREQFGTPLLGLFDKFMRKIDDEIDYSRSLAESGKLIQDKHELARHGMAEHAADLTALRDYTSKLDKLQQSFLMTSFVHLAALQKGTSLMTTLHFTPPLVPSTAQGGMYKPKADRKDESPRPVADQKRGIDKKV